MRLKNFYLCFFGCLVFALSSYAQDKDKAVLLKNLFDEISKRHKVNFNFIEEEIAVFKIVSPDSSMPLDKKLAYITDKTQLKFKYISSNYIAVINNQKLDKPLCGYLIDEVTNQPIDYANITIQGTTFGTSSNEKGYFEIDLKTSNDIVISHVNYQKITLKSEYLYTENCPKISLKPLMNELDEVISQIYLTKGIYKKYDGTFEIKPKDFGILPGLTEPDVFETLKQIPGITTTDETISNLSVRGGTHDQNLFLWNEIRLFQTGHFFGLISALNPNLTQNIKITKNGSSPFYGESVSSVVDISTISSTTDKSNSSVGLNMINADFYSKIKISKNSELELSGRRSITDLVNSPTYKSYYNRIFQNTAVRDLSNNRLINYTNDEKFYFYDFTFQFKQKINSKTELFVDAISIKNLLDFNESKIENGVTISKYSCLEQETLGGKLSLVTDWNNFNQTKITAYGSYYKIISENESIQSNQVFNQENAILDTGIRLKNSHILNDNFQFNNGYQFNEIGIRNFDEVNSPVFSRNIKNVLVLHAAILELEYKSNDRKIKSSFGIRQNYIQKFQEFLFEPRLQFQYSFSNSFKTELLAERKSQVTSQIVDLQQDFLGIEKRRWILANNTTIPVQKSNQISVGFTFKKRNWLLNLENYYKSVNGITSMSQGFQNQLEFLKINGNYTVYGLEFLIQKQYRNFTAWMTYAYMDNNYKFESFSNTPFPNNFDINHNIGMGLTYDYKKVKLALGSRWFTGKPSTFPSNALPVLNASNQSVIAYNFPNSTNLDDYTQVNFSASNEIKISSKSYITLGFSIQNILNSKQIINQNFRINQNTNSIEQVNTFSLERTFNSFLRCNF